MKLRVQLWGDALNVVHPSQVKEVASKLVVGEGYPLTAVLQVFRVIECQADIVNVVTKEVVGIVHYPPKNETNSKLS